MDGRMDGEFGPTHSAGARAAGRQLSALASAVGPASISHAPRLHRRPPVATAPHNPRDMNGSSGAASGAGSSSGSDPTRQWPPLQCRHCRSPIGLQPTSASDCIACMCCLHTELVATVAQCASTIGVDSECTPLSGRGRRAMDHGGIASHSNGLAVLRSVTFHSRRAHPTVGHSGAHLSAVAVAIGGGAASRRVGLGQVRRRTD